MAEAGWSDVKKPGVQDLEGLHSKGCTRSKPKDRKSKNRLMEVAVRATLSSGMYLQMDSLKMMPICHSGGSDLQKAT